ncbi:MAG: hypothetical protein DRG78_12140 [Epsilonproteobacteria bacterium]|nr:MAG: hypothetical protein DRG78_12140 [Campylobacterota bacterium]
MLNEILLPNRPVVKSAIKKKILCIIEGDTEFRYITKIFKLFGYINTSHNHDCFNLSENYIRIAWGNKFAPNINIVQETNKGCKFEGGNSGKDILPFQSISAYEMYKSDLSIFNSIIVIFDKDKDKDDQVQQYFQEALKKITIENLLLVSNPCFESTLIDYCICKECKSIIEKIDKSKEPCDKYKNNIRDLNCLQKYETANGLIANLQNDNLNILSKEVSVLNNMNKIIYNSIKE